MLYYQIDYIDTNNRVTYVNTFHNINIALKELSILNNANKCINTNTKFVIDVYQYIPEENPFDEDFNDVLIIKNLTNVLTISEYENKEKRLKYGNNR